MPMRVWLEIANCRLIRGEIGQLAGTARFFCAFFAAAVTIYIIGHVDSQHVFRLFYTAKNSLWRNKNVGSFLQLRINRARDTIAMDRPALSQHHYLRNSAIGFTLDSGRPLHKHPDAGPPGFMVPDWNSAINLLIIDLQRCIYFCVTNDNWASFTFVVLTHERWRN